MRPRIAAVTARIAPIWSGARLRPNAATRAITAWTRAKTIAYSEESAGIDALAGELTSDQSPAPYAAIPRSIHVGP